MSYFNTKDKKDCCGCTACVHSCPVHAIRFENDEEGFYYPVINKDICINCGLCERVCPVSNPQYDNNKDPEVYAALLKRDDERKMSSSGGLFYAIASWIIKEGGIVYGACINSHNQVSHISAETEQELQKLRGSKYVQSSLGDTYKKVREVLQCGRWCYFVGTGCQVAGLKAFLRKDFDKLVTSDLVCHGVPSQWLFNQHVDYLEHKYKGKVFEYRFRNNKTGMGSEIFKLKTKRGKIREITNPTYNLSPYLYSFMYDMTSRWSCYECKFAAIPRQGDLTLADYWGAKEFFPELDNRNGISLCVVNNEHGQKIWDAIKDECEYRRSNIIDAAKYNGNLVRTSIPHACRARIYGKIREVGYKTVAEHDFRIPNYKRQCVYAKISQSSFLSSIVKALSKIKNSIADRYNKG